jgi:5-methylcytosine-specific restriction endonuclease McrA
MPGGWQGSTRAYRLPGNWKRLRASILDRDGGVCQIRLPGCTGLATEVDHIRPGDDHSESNLRAACQSCNQRANIATRPRPPSEKRPRERHPGLLPRSNGSA